MYDTKITVVTPNYNGIEFLENYFEAIKNQSLSKELFEVIIVDNGSTDGSYQLLMAKYANSQIRVLSYKDSQSSYDARNAGVSLAKGAILAFTDIDCIPDRNWLSNILAAFEKNLNILLAGQLKLKFGSDSPNQYEIFDKQYFLNQESYATEKTGVTANLSIGLKFFESVGGFRSVKSGGDRDFCKRVLNHNEERLEFIYDLNVLVEHPSRKSFDDINTKIIRVSEGIGWLYSEKRTLEKLNIILKTCFSLIFQPKQLREITYVLFNSTYKNKLSFVSISLYFGFKARWLIIKSILTNENNSHS